MHPIAHRLPVVTIQPLRGVRMASWGTDSPRQLQQPMGSEADWLHDAMAHWLEGDDHTRGMPIVPFARMGDGQPDPSR